MNNSVEQGRSGEADSHLAEKEIPCLLCNWKSSYCIHKGRYCGCIGLWW